MRLSMVVGSVVGSLAIAEIGVRWFGPHYSPMAIADGGNRDNRLVHLFEDESFVNDPTLLWRPRPDASVFNSQGYRGRTLVSPRSADEFRVFTIGDSNTLGWAGADGPHWPGLMEQDLAAHKTGLVVVNAGVWGYSSYQGVHRLTETLPYEPDLILISFGANDAHMVDVADKRFAASILRDGPFATLFNRFSLGQLVVAYSDRQRGAGDGELEARVGIDDYRDNLHEMIRVAREHGIQTMLLTRPFVGTSDNPLWWKHRGPLYNAATVEIARDTHVPVVDVYTLFKGQDQYFADESHFTQEGHARAADLIGERILPFLFTADSAPER